MSSYKTVEQEAKAEFIERKSRFIGHVCPVDTVELAQSFVEKIKAEHWQATHNCWAYILRENTSERYSDDGEPQGTAGIPILEVLRKEELTNLAVVVTRYFGGIMLGGGGLIRAYSQGAKTAVDAGVRVIMAPCHVLRIALPYPLYDIFLSSAEDYSMKILDTQFSDIVEVELRLLSAEVERMENLLTQLSSGAIVPVMVGETFAPL